MHKYLAMRDSVHELVVDEVHEDRIVQATRIGPSLCSG